MKFRLPFNRGTTKVSMVPSSMPMIAIRWPFSAVTLMDSDGWHDGPTPLCSMDFTEHITAEKSDLPKTDSKLTKKGDADCSGTVDVSDAVMVARFAAEDSTLVISAEGKANCDTDNNTVIDAEDVLNILRAIAKLITL